jgi:PhnB protein
MLVPFLPFDGRCEEAIAQYVKAFNAELKVLQPYPEEERKKGVMHSEIYIHGQRVMLNDSDSVTPIMVVIYDNKEELLKSYEIMKEGGKITTPLQEQFYSPLVAGITDKFGVVWFLMVGKS